MCVYIHIYAYTHTATTLVPVIYASRESNCNFRTVAKCCKIYSRSRMQRAYSIEIFQPTHTQTHSPIERLTNFWLELGLKIYLW